jgi:cell wall-associated NlpC family hydrolase
VLGVTAAAAVAMSANTAAQAAPKESLSQVKADVNKLNDDADGAIQKYDGAKEHLQQEQKQVSTLENEVAKEQAQVNSSLEGLGSLAASQYRNGAVDPTVQLMMASNPSSYLQKASSLDQLTTQQTDQLNQLKQQQAGLGREKAQAEAKLAKVQATAKQLSSTKTVVQKKLAAAKAKLDSLTSAEREKLQTEENSAVSDAASLIGGNSASGASAAAYAAAKTRLGDSYVYGATGPTTFDCSGLMQWAYQQAGVSLPRDTYGQEDVGTSVPLSEAKVGDLVIMNGGEHVGMYAGNGVVLHAPHTGAVVRYESISTIGSVVTVRRV